MVVTLRTEDEEARRQSGQEGCATTRAAKSTGEVEEGEDAATADTCAELAAKKGAEDPEGTYTSAQPFAAILTPPVEEGRWLSDWVTGAAKELPLDGLERVSATTLDCPAI
jgi:hypothetical protein